MILAVGLLLLRVVGKQPRSLVRLQDGAFVFVRLFQVTFIEVRTQ
jgi:hypothetical protein